jgi:hypothetical protein
MMSKFPKLTLGVASSPALLAKTLGIETHIMYLFEVSFANLILRHDKSNAGRPCVFDMQSICTWRFDNSSGAIKMAP